jgi:hypothetical protein
MLVGLQHVDETPIPDKWEFRLFCKIRNEASRLPFFLSYYRKIGIDRFFIIDNGSTDSSIDYLRQQKDCHLFVTNQSMASARAGMDWIEALLRRYGISRWCLVVDADELFVYPQSETRPLASLCQILSSANANALPCVMIDMYPECDVRQAHYAAGQSFLVASPCFDAVGYRVIAESLSGPTIIGGPRLRMFYPEAADRGLLARFRRAALYQLSQLSVFSRLAPPHPPVLNKVALVLWNNRMSFQPAAHYLFGAELSGGLGALLHFKFLGDFVRRVEEEAVRKVYYQGGREYQRYFNRLATGEPIDFRCRVTTRFTDTLQLGQLNLLREPRAQTGSPCKDLR